jgi:hypothetical protein
VEILGQSLLHVLKIVLTNSNVRFDMYFHGYYAIRLMVCNEALPTSCAHGQDFKSNCIIVTYNTFHNLVLRHVDKSTNQLSFTLKNAHVIELRLCGFQANFFFTSSPSAFQ